jgi:hypothetical protein
MHHINLQTFAEKHKDKCIYEIEDKDGQFIEVVEYAP